MFFQEEIKLEMNSGTLNLCPRVILFDLDGTLADSLPVMRNVYKKFMKQFNREDSDAEFAAINGPPLVKIVKYLQEKHSLNFDNQFLLTSYLDLIDKSYSNVRPTDGAVELITYAKEHNCDMGVVTSNFKSVTVNWLKKVNLSSFIKFVISAEDVSTGKPNPEPYKLAIERAGVAIENIVAIEDSASGAGSAINAGLKTFGLKNGREASNWPSGVEEVTSFQDITKLLFEKVEIVNLQLQQRIHQE